MSADISYRLDPTLDHMMDDLGGGPLGLAVLSRTSHLIATAKPSSSGDALAAALSAHLYVLNYVPDDGLPLTAAGYLKPVDVRHLFEVLPSARLWLDRPTREIDALLLLGFREHLMVGGLLREARGSLVLTRLGRRLRRDPDGLWRHLVEKLIPKRRVFDRFAGTLLALHAATSADHGFDLAVILEILGDLGWSRSNGKPLRHEDLYWLWSVIRSGMECIGPADADLRLLRFSTAAVSLVRDALVTLDTSFGERAAIEA